MAGKLPQDPTEAVKYLTKLVSELIQLMDEESRAMAMKDSIAFTAAQDQKQRQLELYETLSEEFKQRLLDFRSVDKGLLDTLDTTQRKLATKAKDNMEVMAQMQG